MLFRFGPTSTSTGTPSINPRFSRFALAEEAASVQVGTRLADNIRSTVAKENINECKVADSMVVVDNEVLN